MNDRIQKVCVRVYGIVQGVGFRPFVSRIADAGRISGSVCNKGPYVEIIAQGKEQDLHVFLDTLQHHPPVRAVILKTDIVPLTPDCPESEKSSSQDAGFHIIESAKEKGEIFVSPDIAICDECKKELFDPHNRRYLHPFINCTACGPRMTIMEGMPYDRERTSMKIFPMCPQCEYEYTHAQTRRYDAQPVCCNKCGPQVYLLHPGKNVHIPADIKALPESEKDHAAITAARLMIRDGGIAAVKGIGGFHLCCDATSERAVKRLRRLKKRPVKPFAVMMRSLETVHRECLITPAQEEVLDGHQKPIILLRKKESEKGKKLAPSVAPGNPTVGVMLPYAPIQLLLFDYDDGIQMPDCLVMTSGNVSGAPICRDDADVLEQLGGMCDLVLSHNRLIRLRADDSVMDFYQDEPYMIRRSRGYAPLPFMEDCDFKGTVLGIGGELKNTFCIGKNRLFYPSAYIGDMADMRTVKALTESVRLMETLLEAQPEIVACDMHPRYNTTEVAKNLGLPVLEVQHHYAHILSCMAENSVTDRVIGVAFDGTGYGTDGTVWGGEFLLSDMNGFIREGSIAPFWQSGGDLSAREGWRIAVSMLISLIKDTDALEQTIMQLHLCDAKTLKVQRMMHERKINTILSTSAGRLFDSVSAVLGLCRSSSFEGEASMDLQFAAERYKAHTGAEKSAQMPICAQDGRLILGSQQLFMRLLEGKLAGEDIPGLAFLFHQSLAEGIAQMCCRIRDKSGCNIAALSGGVFQNRLLLSLTENALRWDGFRVLRHHLIPPNDGGIALGQALAAMWKISGHR